MLISYIIAAACISALPMRKHQDKKAIGNFLAQTRAGTGKLCATIVRRQPALHVRGGQ